MKKDLVIYCDGGSRGNPGLAASGFAIADGQGNKIARAGRFLGRATNNQAEYQAVVFALKYVLENSLKPEKIAFFLDSELIVRQMNGIYRIKDAGLQLHATAIHKLIAQLALPVSFTHVPRAKNKIADAMVNKALDVREDVSE